jgi:hypothetical protein
MHTSSFISSTTPAQQIMHIVGPSLQQLDSSALAALLKELGRQGGRDDCTPTNRHATR